MAGVMLALDETWLRDTQSNNNELVNKLKKEVTDDDNTLSRKFDLAVKNDLKTLPIMYWLPRMNRTPTGARFIVASRKCSKKTFSNAVTRDFKSIFKQTQTFHEKSHFYFDYKMFLQLKIRNLVLTDRIK